MMDHHYSLTGVKSVQREEVKKLYMQRKKKKRKQTQGGQNVRDLMLLEMLENVIGARNVNMKEK